MYEDGNVSLDEHVVVHSQISVVVGYSQTFAEHILISAGVSHSAHCTKDEEQVLKNVQLHRC